MAKYFKGRICCICGSDHTYIDWFGRQNWFNDYDDRGNWTGKYLCSRCYHRHSPNSHTNIIKSMRDCRNGKFDIENNRCKGCIGVQVAAKTLELKDLNIENNNFNYYVDLSMHPKHGHIEVKTATLDMKNGWWHFSHLDRECDTFLFICMDNNNPWKNIERVYLIPIEFIIGKIGIFVRKYSPRTLWYDKFEIDKEPFNYTYHNMNIEECPTRALL